MVEETKQLAETIGPLGALGVDVKLFFAQLVNFTVVVLVMWRWVYRPLLAFMDERTKKIEQGLNDARDSEVLRKATEQERDRLILEARKQAKEIIDDARGRAAEEHEESGKAARMEADRIIEQGKARVLDEREKMARELTGEMGELVIAAVGRITHEKLDEKKDAELIERSLRDSNIAV
jgi:F-type H+-transporting ATPase subunit b